MQTTSKGCKTLIFLQFFGGILHLGFSIFFPKLLLLLVPFGVPPKIVQCSGRSVLNRSEAGSTHLHLLKYMYFDIYLFSLITTAQILMWYFHQILE